MIAPLSKITAPKSQGLIIVALARIGRKALFLLFHYAMRLARYAEQLHARYIDRYQLSLPHRTTNEPDEVEVAEVLLRYYSHLAIATASMPIKPKISIIMPIYKVDPAFLRQALASIAFQAYQNWEACLVDDASENPKISALILEFAQRFPGQVRHVTNGQNIGISLASNRALELASGEYIALLDHDDQLYPNSLAEIIRHINLHNEPDILYSDEVTVDSRGEPVAGIYYKPKWSALMHLAVNYTTHLSAYKTGLVREVGGFRAGFEGAQDHDLMLRMCEATKKPVVHIPMCLYQWRAHEKSTAASATAKPYAAIAGVRAITEACQRRGMPALVTYEASTLHYRVAFELQKRAPLVSIIIPTRNRLELIRPCLASILEKSTYPHFEIIVMDNGSDDPECLAYLKQKSSEIPSKLQILVDSGSFNFARLNNRAAKTAKGEFLVLLNNDTEVITPEWVEELLRVAQLPNVGAVGGKLIYPNGTIQHAGVALAGRHLAKHILSGISRDNLAYSSYAQTMHETACVTGACLMISRAKYESVGGLDEIYIPNGFGDIDFCLKLLGRGWKNVYTPYAVLFHHESPSRGLSSEVFEQEVILNRWAAQLMEDPYRNFVLGEDTAMQPDRVRMVPELQPKEFQVLMRTAFPMTARESV